MTTEVKWKCEHCETENILEIENGVVVALTCQQCGAPPPKVKTFKADTDWGVTSTCVPYWSYK